MRRPSNSASVNTRMIQPQLPPHPRAAIPRKGRPMSSRKLGELATDIDDASDTVGELKHTPAADAREKLDELHKTLEDASDTIDELVDKDDIVP